MRKGRYSTLQLLTHIDGDREIKFTRNSLGFEIGLEFMNLLFDIFEEVMFLQSSELFLQLDNDDIFKFHLTKISNQRIQCDFYVLRNKKTKELSSTVITLGEFVNDGPKNLIDTVIGLRDLSNEMNRLLNEFVNQNKIKCFIYNSNY